LGFYPTMIMGRPEYHGNWIVKTLRTLWGTLHGVARFPPLHLRVNDRGLIQDHRTRLVLVANNDYEDIFGIIPKRRSLDAGYFTIYVSKHASGFGLLRAAVLWLLGRWKQDREIASIQTSQVEIDVRKKRHLLVMMDGETERISVPFVVKTRAKALRVIAPRLLEEVPVES
jgi:diacylglycerol kinase family enzyme